MPGLLDSNLAALALAQADATPAATAIVAGHDPVTYGSLARRVAAIAAHLRRRGLAPEEPVGVLMKRSPDLIAALLAILHSGGAYVPLDPDDPAQRNRRIQQKSGARLVLTDRDLGAVALPGADLEFAIVADLTAGEPLPPAAPGGARLAYILFTSGSTGEPKGVEIEHRAAVNLLLAARDLFSFTAADRYLATATIGFDVSVPELFLPLICGGSVLLRDRKAWLAPRALADDIRRHGATVVQVGPSVWSVALAEAPDFPRVRVVVTTAEPVPPALARRLAAQGEQAWNLYGPTETTVWSTAHRLTANPAGDTAVSASIGRPIAHTTAHVLNESGAAVPAGEEGELWLGGVGLARGYRANPALTRERFVVQATNGERLYRTGDRAALGADGLLRYFGRLDDQMKIRGVRIEPREVEAAILSHAAVAQAAATWFEGSGGSRSIVAAVVVRAGSSVGPATLHTWLAARLSPQMIPARWLFLADLPRAPSGKVDRNAIRRRAMETAETDASAPARALDATEAELAGIWRRILGRPVVGPEDHFFTVGGDSLAAVRMINEVEERFRIALPVQTVFEAPTLALLAARIAAVQAKSADAGEARFLFPLVEAGRGRPVFFSNVDLKLAARGAWTIDAPLQSISHWAQGRGFIEAESLESLAAVHVAAMRAAQPEGPWRIAGYSFGGLVAFEMARQVRHAGGAVELLFLLDPMQPFRTEQAPGGYAMEGVVTPLDETLAGRLRRHVRQLARNPRRAAAYVGERLRWHAHFHPARQWLTYQLLHLHSRRPNPVSELIVPRDRWPGFWYSARRMAKDYIAHRYDGPAHAVFSDDGERCAVWRSLLGPAAEIEFVPGGHGQLFDEPARSAWQDTLACKLGARRAEPIG